jgi:hypothetical protein
MCEIGSAICLPDTKKYKIQVTINDFTLTTDAPVESKQNYCRWSKRFDTQAINTVYTTVEDLEKIFIYLMDGDKPICYWKGQCSDFLNPDPSYIWLPLACDLSIGSVTD